MNSREPECSDVETRSVDPHRLRAWIYAGIMMICILISLPTTPILWRAGLRTVGPHFNAVGYVAFLVTALGLAVYMIRRRPKTGIFGFLALAGLAVAYAYLLKHHCKFPAERLHLIEYGLLAYLLYRALRPDFTRAVAYALSLLISSGFGFLDEIIQHVLPNRVFELRDVMTNLLASALGLLVVAVLARVNSSEALSSGVDK